MMNVSRPSILEYGTHLRAAAAERLQERIALLLPPERALAELVLREGASQRQIASLLRCTPGTVSRLVRRLVNRLHDPRVVALLHPDCPLDPEYRQVGVERWLQGKPVKQLAHEHGVSAKEIRRRLDAIDFWHRDLAAGKRVAARL